MVNTSLPEILSIVATIPESAWIALALFLALVLVRNGILVIKSSTLETSAYDNIQEDLERLRKENSKLLATNIKLVSFATHVLGHFGKCSDCPEQEASRERLRKELSEILEV